MQIFKKGVLLMDEVDMLLNPLKSELNFPRGERTEICLCMDIYRVSRAIRVIRAM